jgi:hypothetical protein
MEYFKTKDGSIEDKKGRVIFFSKDRFVEEIYYGDTCFLCGVNNDGNVEFNDEHVIPKWLLRKHNLFNKEIILPNGAKRKYGSDYVVGCCKKCNEYLGLNIEQRVKAIIDGGFDSVSRALESNDREIVFLWLCLLFFKTHLIDSRFRYDLDTRKPEKISDLYDVEEFHHIHCIIRSHKMGIRIDPQCVGSLFSLKTIDNGYDYKDLYINHSVMIRSFDVTLFLVINDVGISKSLFRNHLDKISGPISSIQALEIFAHISFINDKLKERPLFFTVCSEWCDPIITVELPEEINLIDFEKEEFGGMFHDILGEYRELFQGSEIAELKEGRRTLLFNEEGEFNTRSIHKE